jgi:hypothetical protein
MTVFMFGMAHKLQHQALATLRTLLDASTVSYAVHVSSAAHATRSIAESAAVADELRPIFGERLFFHGHLTDVAVHNLLTSTTFFASFFPRGVRANNTTVAAAMECGAVVLTNFDRYSPASLRHMVNCLDVDRCESLPTDSATLEQLRTGAREAAASRDWDALVALIQGASALGTTEAAS